MKWGKGNITFRPGISSPLHFEEGFRQSVDVKDVDIVCRRIDVDGCNGRGV